MADKVNEATPGPYHLHDMERFTICGPDHLAIALCEAKNRSDEENQANTDLLAASWEMLQALEAIVSILEPTMILPNDHHEALLLARYASKKARG